MLNVVTNNSGLDNDFMDDYSSMPQGIEINWANAFVDNDDLLDSSSRPEAPVFPSRTATIENMTSCAFPKEELVKLIASMQQCHRMLEHGPWQKESATTLNDYPVGTVLKLSQELGLIASSVLKRDGLFRIVSRREYASDLENATDRESPTNTSDDGSDITTLLLVLSGYMSLVRIYSVVLGHFEIHIGRVSSNNSTDHNDHMRQANANPNLQLGELPCASVTPALGKIRTAFRLLVAAMHGVEETLGTGGAMARNLVVALLAQEAVLDSDDVRVYMMRKVRLVDELLQDKMNV